MIFVHVMLRAGQQNSFLITESWCISRLVVGRSHFLDRNLDYFSFKNYELS